MIEGDREYQTVVLADLLREGNCVRRLCALASKRRYEYIIIQRGSKAK